MTKLEEAYFCYIARQDRREHPDGKFDKQWRWYPSASEQRECCKKIRSPSRAFPYSYIKHCRNVEHVARLFDIDPKELAWYSKRMRPWTEAAARS